MKDRTVRRSWYNKNTRKNTNHTTIEKEIGTSTQQSEIDNVNNKNANTIVSTYENHANVVIGPRNVGKTYYKFKYLKKEVTKDLFI